MRAGGKTVIVDCHSFPSDEYEDAPDICIAYNADKTSPGEAIIRGVEPIFKECRFAVKINEPFCNSIKAGDAKSFMIAVNKRCYLNEHTFRLDVSTQKTPRVCDAILKVYKYLLGK